MEDLDSDLLSIICLYIPTQSITSLTVSTSTLTKKISQIWENNLFWKRYTELFLAGGKELATKKHLKDRNADWRVVYNIINELYVNWEIKNMDLSAMIEDADNEVKTIETASLFDGIENLESYQNDDILQSIYILIELGYDPSVNDNYLIKYVSKHKYTNIVEILLKDPNIHDSMDHNELIILAAENNQVEIFQLLLSDERTIFRKLHKIFLVASINIIKILISDSEFDYRTDRYGFIDDDIRYGDIIDIIIKRKEPYVIEFFLKSPEINLEQRDICRILSDACKSGYLDIIKFLLTDTRCCFYKNYNIISALEYYPIDTVKLLLKDERFYPSIGDNKIIIAASLKGREDIVKLLLEDKYVNPSANDNQAIRFAAEGGHINVIKLLLEDKRVDPSAKQNQAIMVAAEHNHANVMKLLMMDPRVNPFDINNYIATESYKYKKIVRLLLGHSGFNLNCGKIMFQLACMHQVSGVVKLLLKDRRTDPNGKTGYYGINYAARHGYTKIVKILLKDSRVDPSCYNNYPIKKACKYGHIEIVRLLLEDNRVNPFTDNYAINKAYINNHTKIIKLLQNKAHILGKFIDYDN
jgi:ankyrin repeat protein